MKARHDAFILSIIIILIGFCSQAYADDEHKVNIGLIVDNGSWVGKLVHSCVNMAISDFYDSNNTPHKTKIALHVRDSRGDSLHSITAAIDLLENVEVQAIIIPEISNEESLLTRLGDEANVPILSFSSVSSISTEHPYLIQVGDDYNSQFQGVAAFIKAFNWSSFVFLYEDTADAREFQTYVYDIFQENQLNLAYQTAISLTATDHEIANKLNKLMLAKSSIILVHLSPSLASRVFTIAKVLGMMNKGYAWITTSKTMNFLSSRETSSVYESMDGVVGFKAYISSSSKLQSLNLRWMRENNFNTRELNVYGLWAYDAAWIVAEAIGRAEIHLSENRLEDLVSKQLDLGKIRVSKNGPSILAKIMSSKYRGLAGAYLHLTNRKLVHETYEILNVIGTGERRVGLWRSGDELTKELETVIWPGLTLTPPAGLLVQMSGKSFRIGVPANGRFTELVEYDEKQQSNKPSFKGFCIDVFQAALDRSTYHDISIEYIPYYNENGSYTNLVQLVHEQTFDAAVGDITILSNRSQYVDFTVPYTEIGLGMVVKLDDNDPWFFLKPLDPDLWITSACFFLMTGFIVWLIEHRINEEFQGPLAHQIGTLLWFAASTLVYAHREKLRSNISRFVVGTWLFVVLILTSSYTANLSSLLTIKQIKLTKSDYIGYSANSPLGLIIRHNTNFADNRLKSYRSTEEYDEALRKGSREGGVDAIIDEMPYIKLFVAKYPHDYAMIKSSTRTGGFGFAFQKGSPLVPEISRAITELREEGKIEEMEKKWFKPEPSLLSRDDTEPPKFNTLSLDNFYGLFLISGIANFIAILSLVFLVSERLSLNYYIIRMLGRGNLMFILRYFTRRMGNILNGR